jgi:uncharacterized protein YndB with AHSA1/START domain
MTEADGSTILTYSLLSMAALVILGPILVDLLALFGVRVQLRPKFRVAREAVSPGRWLKFVLGLLSLLVLASLVLNPGWLRILFGVVFLVHFVLFRTLSSYVLRKNPQPPRLWFSMAWATFVLGYVLLPDFGDTEESVMAFFGLVRYRPAIDVMMGLATVLLVLNVVVSVVLWVRTKRISASKDELVVKNVSTIRIAAPAARVWQTLTQPSLVKQWQYGSDLDTTWQVGSPVRFKTVWQDTVFEQWGTVLAFEPHARLQYSLFAPRPGLEDKPENYFTMTYQLTPEDGVVKLEIVQEDGREGATKEPDQGEENPVLAELKKVAERD